MEGRGGAGGPLWRGPFNRFPVVGEASVQAHCVKQTSKVLWTVPGVNLCWRIEIQQDFSLSHAVLTNGQGLMGLRHGPPSSALHDYWLPLISYGGKGSG